MSKKVMICFPMSDHTDEENLEIMEKYKNIFKDYEKKFPEEGTYEFLDSYFIEFIEGKEEIKHKDVLYLGKSIEVMAKADIVFFGKDWSTARGCSMEHQICSFYEVDKVYYEDMLYKIFESVY